MRRLAGRTLTLFVRDLCAENRAAVAALQAFSFQQRHKFSQAAACAVFNGFRGVKPSRSWVRLRSFASAAEPAAAEEKDSLEVSDAAVERLRELGPDVVLRIMVEGGGCSGFQYEFTLDDSVKEGDRVFERDGVKVVCDDLSLEFLRGATVDFESNLMRSAFVIGSNPNAASSCGCGSSFVAK